MTLYKIIKLIANCQKCENYKKLGDGWYIHNVCNKDLQNPKQLINIDTEELIQCIKEKTEA